jgi:hypothetical protein
LLANDPYRRRDLAGLDPTHRASSGAPIWVKLPRRPHPVGLKKLKNLGSVCPSRPLHDDRSGRSQHCPSSLECSP